MLIAVARQRVAALRQPRRASRLALLLWVAWAVVVWNVVFDHVIVVAGREYIAAALAASHEAADRDLATPGRGSSSYANMDRWMRPAVTRGLWVASSSASAILCAGFFLVRAARTPLEPVSPCA